MPALRGVYCDLNLLPAEIKYFPCEITGVFFLKGCRSDPWYQPSSPGLVVTLLLHDFLPSAQRHKDAQTGHTCPGWLDGNIQKISLEACASLRWPVGSPTFIQASNISQAKALKMP